MIDAWGDQPAPEKVKTDPVPYVPPDKHIPGLRIGDRVRIIEGDVFTSAGMEGRVVNTVPARPSGWVYGAARVVFDDDTVAIIGAERIDIIERKAA